MHRVTRGCVAGAAALGLLVVAGCQQPRAMTTGSGGQGQPRPTKASETSTPYLDQPTGWGPTEGEWLAARRAVSKLGDDALAGQVIVAAYDGMAAPVSLVARYHLGGVIVQSGNISSPAALEAATAHLQASDHRPWPLVVVTDQEGGIVQRVGPPLTQFPAFMSYGAADDPGLTRAAARASGEELRAVGFTMVFAPDADVTIGPADPTIGSRSAGDEPEAVATQVVAAMAGYRQSGIVPVVKHFPGHGSVTADSHVTLPVQDRSVADLFRRDFVPFGAAAESGASAVMVGHIALTAVDPGVPADLSRADLAILRTRIGFQGLVTTDALNMAAVTDTFSSGAAAVRALQAGADMLLMPADVGAAYQGILDAMRNGTLPRSRVEDAASRMVALMMHERHQPKPDPASIGTHARLSEQVSARALTLVSGPCVGPYVGRTVTPEGDPAVVASFTAAARTAGLVVGPGGTTVALLGYGYRPASADVVVSLDTPYVLADSSATTARIALYGADDGAMRALVAALTGKAPMTGRLPVSVPGLDQQSAC